MPNRPESHSRSDQADEQNARLKAFDAKFVSYSSAYNLTAVTRHLRFYKAFLASATSTGAPYFERDAKTNLDEPSPAFRALLTKALVRFEAWVRRVLPARISGDPLLLSEVPPLDVLAVLHAYLLSPKIFDHDSTVRFPQLQSITFPLEHLEALIRADSGIYSPTAEQVHLWESMTGLPFDVRNMKPIHEVTCPSCNKPSQVPWTEQDTPQAGACGYAETGFRHLCSCGLEITHGALAAKKLVEDLIVVTENQRGAHLTTEVGNETSSLQNADFAKKVIYVLGDPNDNLGERLGWDVDEAERLLARDQSLELSEKSLVAFLEPYRQSSPFSVDIIYKGFCQVRFASTAKEKGLLDESVIKGAEQDTLNQHLRSYHIFLKLHILENLPEFCPTHGADLVWHTHQLHGARYKREVQDMIGHFADHISFRFRHIAAAPALYYKEHNASLDWQTALISAGIPVNDAVIFSGILAKRFLRTPSHKGDGGSDPAPNHSPLSSGKEAPECNIDSEPKCQTDNPGCGEEPHCGCIKPEDKPKPPLTGETGRPGPPPTDTLKVLFTSLSIHD